jgi:hypothetical protein
VSALPHRVQLSRKKGWRKPENTAVVSRPSKWGNPFAIGSSIDVRMRLSGGSLLPGTLTASTAGEAVTYFRQWLQGEIVLDQARPSRDVFDELTTRNLACWCPLDQPCHADVLLEYANGENL